METQTNKASAPKTGGEAEDKKKRKSERLTTKEEKKFDAKLPANKRAAEPDSDSDSDSDEDIGRDEHDGLVDVYKDERFVP